MCVCVCAFFSAGFLYPNSRHDSSFIIYELCAHINFVVFPIGPSLCIEFNCPVHFFLFAASFYFEQRNANWIPSYLITLIKFGWIFWKENGSPGFVRIFLLKMLLCSLQPLCPLNLVRKLVVARINLYIYMCYTKQWIANARANETWSTSILVLYSHFS